MSPKVGDHVRVVLEGVVTKSFGSKPCFWIGSRPEGRHKNFIDQGLAHVKSVEILTPPVKVGDKITSYAALDDLPGHTVVRSECGVINEKDGRLAWLVPGLPGHDSSCDIELPATILYLPDSA